MLKQSSNNRQIAKNTLFLYIRMLLIMVVSLYTSRVILQTLGVEDYGIYNVVGGVVTMFAFINNAMSSSTMRFMTFELGRANKESIHRVFCTSINIHACISLIILIFSETVGIWVLNHYMVIPITRMEAAHFVFQFSVLSTIIMVMSVPYNAAIIAHEKMSAFAYISVLEAILKLSIVYILVIFDTDKLKLYAVLLFCIQILIIFIYSYYCIKHFRECHYKFLYDKELFKEMTSFAGWSLFGNLAAVAFTQGVNILLNIFFGPVVNTARAIAVQVQHAVQGFISNFQMALNPQITKTYSNGDLKRMHQLIFASGRYSFFLLLFLSLPIIIETETILSIWLVNVPVHTVDFIRVIFSIMMVDALANPLIAAAQATGRIKVYQAVVGSILLMIVPFSYVALELGKSPVSVFIVHFVMVVVAHIARLFMVRQMIHLSLHKYFTEVIIRIVPVFIVAFLLPVGGYFLLPKNTLLSFLIICIMCFLSVTVSVYCFGMEKDERSFVIKKIYDFKQKLLKDDTNYR